MSVLVEANKQVGDIFNEIQKYEPSINRNDFILKQSLSGDLDDDYFMREINLKMPVDSLKSNNIFLIRKIFYDDPKRKH